jgi:hypothetical protein
MELRDWLTAVAVRNGAAPSSANLYHGFATHIRKAFPRLPCSDATAYAVGGLLGGTFPTWDELRDAIRAIMTEVTALTGPAAPDTEEARMTALWVSYYRRRLRESPHRQWHLLSLLRKVDMLAFKEVDDGFWAKSEADFDHQFWEARGGHVHHDPADHRKPDDTIGRVPVSYPRSAKATPQAPPARPPSGALPNATLIAQYRAMAAEGNQSAIARLATLEQGKP